MTNPDCFHWEDANDTEPPAGVEVIGMWIDSDGTTSTLPVVYDSAGQWTYDDSPTRWPHAWCANLDAHQPPRTGETQPVKTPPKTPLWVRALAITVMALTSAILGCALGMGLGAALANHNATVGTTLAVLIVAGAWAPTVVDVIRRRKEAARGTEVQAPAQTD